RSSVVTATTLARRIAVTRSPSRRARHCSPDGSMSTRPRPASMAISQKLIDATPSRSPASALSTSRRARRPSRWLASTTQSRTWVSSRITSARRLPVDVDRRDDIAPDARASLEGADDGSRPLLYGNQPRDGLASLGDHDGIAGRGDHVHHLHTPSLHFSRPTPASPP